MTSLTTRDASPRSRACQHNPADASLVAAAEQLQLRRIFTLDRYFHAYRSDGKNPFDVIPQLRS
jgi:predicted nucleic acid-binding protein